MLDKATVQRIKDVADIVEVVSDYVHLTRRGANYMGLCPFHNERTPSFSVNKRRNFCYCFSCHKGGSPVNFIMEKEGVSYHDALLHLAKKYGIKVEERELTDEERKLQSEREGMLVAAERAMRLMEADLKDTPDGRDIGLAYLYSRGVTEEAIRKYHLGYALDKGDHLTSLMIREGYESDVLRALGLTGLSSSGHLYDKYRGRVIFPIMNSSGKVVGFGGRDLKGGPAKYINSPESPLYHKNNELYGIYQAKAEIVRQDNCYLVEGYLDVIGMWQSGMQNTVASSGTALTDGQIALIHRFTNNITLIYDGDAAGIKAALRGIDMLLSHNMKVKVLLLPDGEDPDSFARKHTPEEFREFVIHHQTDIIRFKIQVLMAEAQNDAQKMAKVVNSVVESLACIPDDVERMVYVSDCSRILKIDETAISNAVERARASIVSRQIEERRKRQALRDFPESNNEISDKGEKSDVTGNSNLSPESNSGKDSYPDQESLSKVEKEWKKSIERNSRALQYPLMPLEKNMIELLIKHGYQDFVYIPKNTVSSDSDDHPDEEEGIFTNLDFIMEELETDKIEFSVPLFDKIFHYLYDEIDNFIKKLDNFEAKLDVSLDEERSKGRQKIASDFSSIPEIEREEKKLERDLNELKREKIAEFARYYPGNMLASHEDDEIRNLANELINEKYVLSGIFTKNASPVKDSDISLSLMRALTEWKSEILNQKLKNLLEEFRENSGKNEEEDFKVLSRINNLMAMRSKVAKDIGERLISPRRR